MERDGGSIGSKRRASDALRAVRIEERPRKVRRLLDLWESEASFASQVLEEGSRSDVPAPEASIRTPRLDNTSSTPLRDSRCIRSYANSPIGAGSSFECRSLIAALNSASSFAGTEHGEDGSGMVHVPGSVFFVKISWQVVLAEICKRLGLKVVEKGSFDEADGMLRGWIEIDIAALSIEPLKKPELFIDDEKSFHDDAMESVAEAVVLYLRKHYGVVVQDVNYHELKSLERRATRAEFFSTMFSDMLSAGNTREEVLRREYDGVFTMAREICQKFKDVIPVTVVNVTSPLGSRVVEKMVYAGPRPAANRLDEFTFDLVWVLNKALDLGLGSRESI